MKKLTQEQIENIRKNPDKWAWNWEAISQYDLPEDFIKEFKNRINWFMILIHHKFSESFFIEFQYKLFGIGGFRQCCHHKNYNNVKLYLKYGMKLDNDLRKCLIE
ncbi:hypothetical protein KY334_07050 [Candidatus Woesearchaeota archaeon]|nr:hypothetical protein [Candidatus Woesearchaeota archaeon]